MALSYSGLSKIRVFGDGEPLIEHPACGLTFTCKLSIPPITPSRTLTALAIDRNGLVSEPATIPTGFRGTGERNSHAVVVGIDHFADSQLELKFGISDAIRLASLLRSAPACYYRSTHVQQLLGEFASRDAILHALRTAAAQAASGDRLIFSFASHGVKAHGNYYLTPAGFTMQSPRETGLPWKAIADVLCSSKARIIVLLDACHSTLAGVEGLANNEEIATELLQGTRSPILLLAAAKARQSTWEGPLWGGGVFTYALSDVIQTNRNFYDLDGDGVLSMSELFRGLRAVIRSAIGGNQQPWLARHDMIGDFPMI